MIGRPINKLATLYKSLGLFGLLRFRILRFAYILFPRIGSRGKEWAFVLRFLPKLKKRSGQVFILDVGGSSSLFVYELASRRYQTFILDQRPYQERLPENIIFIEADITNTPMESEKFDYITAISVIEHIGLGTYGDSICDNGDKKAIKEIARILKKGGHLLITVPNKIFAQGSDHRGYTYLEFKDLVLEYFDIQECTELRSQICACLVKK